jgi:hypothetical protein
MRVSGLEPLQKFASCLRVAYEFRMSTNLEGDDITPPFETRACDRAPQTITYSGQHFRLADFENG